MEATPIPLAQGWPALAQVRYDAVYNFRHHQAAAVRLSRLNRRFGTFVVLITAIVSTSVFAALTQNGLNIYVQIATGVLSVLASALAAAQTFLGFSDLATAHNDAANRFAEVKNRIDIFTQRFSYEQTLKDTYYAERTQKAEDEIVRLFTAARQSAPILPIEEEVVTAARKDVDAEELALLHQDERRR